MRWWGAIWWPIWKTERSQSPKTEEVNPQKFWRVFAIVKSSDVIASDHTQRHRTKKQKTVWFFIIRERERKERRQHLLLKRTLGEEMEVKIQFDSLFDRRRFGLPRSLQFTCKPSSSSFGLIILFLFFSLKKTSRTSSFLTRK